VAKEGRSKVLKSELRRGLIEHSAHSLVGRRQEKAGTIVEALADEFGEKNLVALRVRRPLELGEHREVRFLDAHGRRRSTRLLEQEEVAEPGLGGGLERPLAIGGEDVRGVPQGLLGAVVVVVAEGGTDLGFELDRGEQAKNPGSSRLRSQ
jgi:hypothetical protein